jgi:hypothetical protein
MDRNSDPYLLPIDATQFENVAAAEQAADEAWRAAKRSGQDRARAWHRAFVGEMRRLGTPIACACEWCMPATP